jgi:hypothetical protein
MTVQEAIAIIYGLSAPSKMPGYGYSIPPAFCITGSKLREVPNSVCSKCYACKGRYTMEPAQHAMVRRYESLAHPQWVEAMSVALQGKKEPYFRWHDAGDLQGGWHLKNIIKVAEKVPHMNFWLPTKEKKILIKQFTKSDYVPPNLCIRLSSTLIDSYVDLPESIRDVVQTSTVHWKHDPVGFECPAPRQGNKCGTCRACWDTEVPNVSYHKH